MESGRTCPICEFRYRIGIFFRWLFCHNKKEQAVKNVQFAAKVNGLPVLYIADVEEDIVLSESSATGSYTASIISFCSLLIFLNMTTKLR